MENMKGQTLASCWNILATSAKTSIADRLRDVLNHLYNPPCPECFESLGNRALEDSMFWTADRIALGVIIGPFETEVQLNKAMALKYLYNDMSPQAINDIKLQIHMGEGEDGGVREMIIMI
jgi:hypothetical protein